LKNKKEREMIKINVTKPIAIPGESQRSVDLKAGVHEVQDSILDHWYVQSLMKSGVITIVKSKANVNFKSHEQIKEEIKINPTITTHFPSQRPVVSQIIINKVEEIKPKPKIEELAKPAPIQTEIKFESVKEEVKVEENEVEEVVEEKPVKKTSNIRKRRS